MTEENKLAISNDDNTLAVSTDGNTLAVSTDDITSAGSSDELTVKAKKASKSQHSKATKENFWVRPEKGFLAKSKDGQLTEAEKVWKNFLDELSKANNPDEFFGDMIKILCHLMEGYVQAYIMHHRLERGKSVKAFEDTRDAYIKSQAETLGREQGIREKVFDYMENSMFSDMLRNATLWDEVEDTFKKRYQGKGAVFYIDPVTQRECINMQALTPAERGYLIQKLGGPEALPQKAKKAVEDFVTGDLFDFDIHAKGHFKTKRTLFLNAVQWIPGIGALAQESFGPDDFVGDLKPYYKDIIGKGNLKRTPLFDISSEVTEDDIRGEMNASITGDLDNLTDPQLTKKLRNELGDKRNLAEELSSALQGFVSAGSDDSKAQAIFEKKMQAIGKHLRKIYGRSAKKNRDINQLQKASRICAIIERQLSLAYDKISDNSQKKKVQNAGNEALKRAKQNIT